MRWSNKRVGLGIALALVVVTAGLGWRFVPAFRWGGAAMVGAGQPLAALGGTLAVPRGGTIVCEGDSLTYGAQRRGGSVPAINGAGAKRVATPFPETLARALGEQVRVVNHGYPADTTAMGVRRWASEPRADLVVLMYGTNDANPRGWRHAVPIDAYRATLAGLVRRHVTAGAQVLVLAPPPAGTAYAAKAIAPYREAARAAAAAEGVAFADPAAFLQGLAVPLQADGLHLRAEAAARIGEGIARRITVR
ncbi:SGNH/GDSL hydrolase family protein [Sphingomonas trueperi]|uniref:SGNH/GDSL hydrolase family protein n=1 Tax=Sphingomonas trueperi TaxID=53317 RepID=UPI000EB26C2F